MGAEFASTEASRQLLTAEQTVQDLFNKTKLAELDLTKAQQSHIEKSARIMKQLEEEDRIRLGISSKPGENNEPNDAQSQEDVSEQQS